MEFSDDLQMMHSIQIYRCINLQRLSHALHLSPWNTDLGCDEVRLWIIIWESASASKCDFITLVSDSVCCQAHLLWPVYSPKGHREMILNLSLSFSAVFQHLFCLTGFAVNMLARMSVLSSSSSPAVADNGVGVVKLVPIWSGGSYEGSQWYVGC